LTVFIKDEAARRARRAARFGVELAQDQPDPDVPSAAVLEPEVPPLPPTLTPTTLLRPQALFFTSKSLGNLGTSDLLRFVNSLVETRASFQGVEWIDDISVCLRFQNHQGAALGFRSLVRDGVSDDDLAKLVEVLDKAGDMYNEVRLANPPSNRCLFFTPASLSTFSDIWR
jgi:hypothetical protein